MTLTMSEQLGHSAISSPFSRSSYKAMEKGTYAGNHTYYTSVHLSDLELVATGTGEVVGLCLRIILEVLNLNFIMEYRHWQTAERESRICMRMVQSYRSMVQF